MDTIKVKTNYVPQDSEDYLTKGKVYQATFLKEDLYHIICDEGDGCNIVVGSGMGCAHIDGHEWEVVSVVKL